MSLLTPFGLDIRIATIRMLEAKVSHFYYEYQQPNLSGEVRQAYEAIMRDYFYKLQKEVHNLWLNMCENSEAIEKELRIPPS
jgi:hypothetical protein